MSLDRLDSRKRLFKVLRRGVGSAYGFSSITYMLTGNIKHPLHYNELHVNWLRERLHSVRLAVLRE